MKKTVEYLFGDKAVDLKAKFMPEVVELNYIDSASGVKNTKYIDYGSFFLAVNQQVQLKTGLLAPGVRYMIRKENRTYLLLEDPGRCRELTFNNKKSKDEKPLKAVVPMPTTLVGMCLQEGAGVQNALVWCLPSPIRDINETVYEFPFGNSYGQSGKFCWGSSQKFFQDIKEIRHARSIFSLIYGSTFNSDLQGRFNVVPPMPADKIKNIESFYKYLDGKDKFPIESLLSCGNINHCLKKLTKETDYEDVPF